MNPFARFPFIRFVLPLMAGIVISVNFHLTFYQSFIPLCIGTALNVLIAYSRFFKLRYQWRYMFAIGLQLFWIGLGATLVSLSDPRTATTFFESKANQKALWVKLKEPPSQKKKSFKALAEIKGVFDGQEMIPATGWIIVYFLNDSTKVKTIYCSDELLIKAATQPIPSPKNPGEFDYGAYLANQHIFHQVYLKANEWSLIKNADTNDVLKWVFLARDWLLSKLNNYIESDTERGVAGALLFGFKDNLDNEVVNAYARTGTLHVLAVSGMHVAILYLVVSMVFKQFQKTKLGAWLIAFATIAIIWFYSLISGMSPSIVRASVMFTIIVLGKALRDDISIYNNLFTSACFILCYDPLFLFDAGFQLSYLAVLGIVYFQPKIGSLLVFKSWVAQQIWGLLTVSLSAQITTFPISLFYFNQFPNYFLFSNLIIIPITTFIMYLGILLIVMSWWHPLAVWLGWAITKLIGFADALIIRIQELPYAVTEGLYFTKTETVLWYTFMLMVSIYFVAANKFYLRIAFSLLLLLAGFAGLVNYQQTKQQTLVLNAIKGGSCINIIDGFQNYLIADTTFGASPQNLKSHFKGWWNSHHVDEAIMLSTINKFETTAFIYHPNYLVYKNKTLIIIGEEPFPPNIVAQANYLWVKDGCDIDLEKVLAHCRPQKIILDFMMKSNKRKKYLSVANGYNIPVHDMSEKGAFILE